MKKSAKTKNNVKMKNSQTARKTFYYEPTLVDPKTVNVHPFLNIIGYDAPDDVFLERASHFRFYERCVVTEDGYVITHPCDLLAAQDNGLDEIEVIIMKNASESDLIDFISFKNVWEHGKSRRKIYDTVKLLTQYVSELDSEGRKKHGGGKTRQIVAGIMGVSDGSIQNIKQIGDANAKFLDKIDGGELTASEALKAIKPAPPVAAIPFESRKRYADLIISNDPDISNGELAKLTVRRAVFEIDQIGTIDFRIDRDSASMSINGSQVKTAFHNVVSDKDNEGKREYCQHHTLLPDDDEFDVQFVLKGLEKYIAETSKAAA